MGGKQSWDRTLELVAVAPLSQQAPEPPYQHSGYVENVTLHCLHHENLVFIHSFLEQVFFKHPLFA